MEVLTVKTTKLFLMLMLAMLLAAGCVEDIERGTNRPPRVWFERSPAEGSVVFSNSADFEWQASDWDDDLGMGAAYVRLDTVAAGDDTWERIYDNVYQILDLPDSTYNFRVRIVDPRDAETIITRNFTVRFDPHWPVIDSLIAPPAKAPKQDFTANYIIYAHDIAPSGLTGEGDPETLPWPDARAASPPESLMFWVRMVGPGCFENEEFDFTYGATYASGETTTGAYFTYSVSIPGAQCSGKYTFRGKVRDRAGNVTPEIVASFEVPK
jgi:hypothetical protein